MNKHTRSVSLIDGHIEEMTDAEIKKALECCEVEFENCEKCPYGGIDCLNEKGESLVMRDALDLINRLQSKNKEFDEKNVLYKGLIDRQQTEIERLQSEKAKLHKLIPKMIKESKSEAIKEFLPKIKAHAYYIDFPKRHRVVDEDDIDNLVKEMTEVQE